MREPPTSSGVPVGDAADRTSCGPWNPGIESRLPRQLVSLATIFRPENVFTGERRAQELSDLCGLEPEELVSFRPRRLVLHELLIRITSDVYVPDGPRVEDLGIHFRRMTARILAQYIEPHMREIERAYDERKLRLAQTIEGELAGAFEAARPARSLRARLRRVFTRPAAPEPGARKEATEAEERLLQRWQAGAESSEDPEREAAYRALHKLVSALRARHGRIWGERSLIASIAADLAANDHGSAALGRLIEPYLQEAVRREGYTLLPVQAQPVVMNTKGASASGKSTMRPLHKSLAGVIGANWSEFAVISPDIWRKQLLDYSSLGSAYKYAGSLTGHELRIVDQKLDRYMAEKAERSGMPHLLIDRFRFDSFAPDSDEAGSNMLTRFGHRVYLFFLITPPHATVERAWTRGLEVGRYKAVDDLLAHNVEAYRGMPGVFFTWALRSDKWVHYEFLDNSVPLGERPRTVAFGCNGELNVLDVKCMLDVERYRKIDVDAAGPSEVYRDRAAMAAQNSTQFLVQCARTLPSLNFADRDSGRIYACIESGALVWSDRDALARAVRDPETRAGILAVAPGALGATVPAVDRPRWLADRVPLDRLHTLGHWGTQARESLSAAS